MPRRYKNRKKQTNENVNIVEIDDDSQVFGLVTKALGCRFFDVNCLDGINRRCKARKKRMRINIDDWCIISLRNFGDNKNADIIHKYTSDEVREMKNNNILPTTGQIGDSFIEDENDLGFDFNSI